MNRKIAKMGFEWLTTKQRHVSPPQSTSCDEPKHSKAITSQKMHIKQGLTTVDSVS